MREVEIKLSSRPGFTAACMTERPQIAEEPFAREFSSTLYLTAGEPANERCSPHREIYPTQLKKPYLFETEQASNLPSSRSSAP